jgi:hypothetical protein
MAIDMRAKHRYCAVTVLLFYILKNPSTRALYFPNIHYNTVFQDFILHAAMSHPLHSFVNAVTTACSKLESVMFDGPQWHSS